MLQLLKTLSIELLIAIFHTLQDFKLLFEKVPTKELVLTLVDFPCPQTLLLFQGHLLNRLKVNVRIFKILLSYFPLNLFDVVDLLLFGFYL